MPSETGDTVVIGGRSVRASDVAQVMEKTGSKLGRVFAWIRLSWGLGKPVNEKMLTNIADRLELSEAEKVFGAFERSIPQRGEEKSVKPDQVGPLMHIVHDRTFPSSIISNDLDCAKFLINVKTVTGGTRPKFGFTHEGKQYEVWASGEDVLVQAEGMDKPLSLNNTKKFLSQKNPPSSSTDFQHRAALFVSAMDAVKKAARQAEPAASRPSEPEDMVVVGSRSVRASDVAQVAGKTGSKLGNVFAWIRLSWGLGKPVNEKMLTNIADRLGLSEAEKVLKAFKNSISPRREAESVNLEGQIGPLMDRVRVRTLPTTILSDPIDCAEFLSYVQAVAKDKQSPFGFEHNHKKYEVWADGKDVLVQAEGRTEPISLNMLKETLSKKLSAAHPQSISQEDQSNAAPFVSAMDAVKKAAHEAKPTPSMYEGIVPEKVRAGGGPNWKPPLSSR